MVFRTNRSLGKVFWLSLITGGIYGIWFYSTVGEDINMIAPHRQKTMHYCLIYFLLSWLTLGIAPIVWFHKISAKIGDTLRERGINYDFGASTYWLWNVLGSLIIVGPFIYIHKFCKAMNLLCDSQNRGAGQAPYGQPYAQPYSQPYNPYNPQ